MKRVRVALLAAVAATVVAVGPAQPSSAGCRGESGEIHVFSRASVGVPATGVPNAPSRAGAPIAPGSKFIACGAGADDYGVDSMWIYPGTGEISVRFTEDLHVPELAATVEGLGVNATIKLVRNDGGASLVGSLWNAILGPSYVYDAEQWLVIDPTATGDLKVSVVLPEFGTATETYRTLR